MRSCGGPTIRATGWRDFAPLRLVPGVGPATATRLLDALDGDAGPDAGDGGVRGPAAVARDRLERVRCALFRALGEPTCAWPADSSSSSAGTSRISSASTTMRSCASGDLVATPADRVDLPVARAVPHRADARSARRDQRRGGAPGRDDDYLILSTIHSAKGQEWKAVHVLNVVDGCIPSDMAHRERAKKSRRSGGCSTSR